MIKEFSKKFLLLTFGFIVLGFLLAYLSGVLKDQSLGHKIFSILYSLYFLALLKLLLDYIPKITQERIIKKKKRPFYKTIKDWLDDGAMGYEKVEKRLLKSKPKYNFLKNLEIIRNEFITLGPVKANLIKANLKARQATEVYTKQLLTVIFTIGTGILSWGFKSKFGYHTKFDITVNLIQWVIFAIICLYYLIRQVTRISYKDALLIEIIDGITDDDYKKGSRNKNP
jgi:hypothetical protein